MVEVPAITGAAALNVIVSLPVKVPPLLVQLPFTVKLCNALSAEALFKVTFPATIKVLPFLRESVPLAAKLPNVIAALGATEPLPVITKLLPAVNVSAVPLFTNPCKMLMVPAPVVNTGLLTASPKVNEGEEPLKLIVPVVLVILPLPLPINTGLPKVNDPVVTEISSVATAVLAIQVILPSSVNEPVVTVILQTKVAVLLVPVKIRLPCTTPVKVVKLRLLLVAAVGWFMVKSPFTVTVTPAAGVKVRAAATALPELKIRFVKVLLLLSAHATTVAAPVFPS